MELKHKLTVGADPEIFLTENGLIIPSCGLVGGTKDSPKQITEHTSIQEDNVTVEFNVRPVEYSYGSRALHGSAMRGLTDVQNYLRNINPNYDYLVDSSHVFSEAELASEQARRFGCEPDLNAHTGGTQNRVFEASEVGRGRFCGGHIHLGFPDEVEVPKSAIVQLLDALVTLPAIADFGSEIVGAERVKFYGKAGAYRDKPYGLEYRTPSNFWLARREIADTYCDVALWVINNPSEARIIYDKINFGIVEACINNLDIKMNLVNLLLDLRQPIYDEAEMYKRGDWDGPMPRGADIPVDLLRRQGVVPAGIEVGFDQLYRRQ